MFLSEYQFASELDRHFIDTKQEQFTVNDYYNVIETFLATGSDKNKKICLELFKRLPKEEVIRRSATVVRLTRLLSNIRHNNDISRQSSITE